jgi:hypothetical protein
MSPASVRHEDGETVSRALYAFIGRDAAGNYALYN